MEDLGRRLCDLIQHAVGAGEPEASLRAVAALREDLIAFEEAQVARAFRRGASYRTIAEALGISRQAAHRRYRDVVGRSGPSPRPRGTRRSPRPACSSPARRAPPSSSHSRCGTPCAGATAASAVEHLLVASVEDDEGGAHRTLQALGVDPASVVERL